MTATLRAASPRVGVRTRTAVGRVMLVTRTVGYLMLAQFANELRLELASRGPSRDRRIRHTEPSTSSLSLAGSANGRNQNRKRFGGSRSSGFRNSEGPGDIWETVQGGSNGTAKITGRQTE